MRGWKRTVIGDVRLGQTAGGKPKSQCKIMDHTKEESEREGAAAACFLARKRENAAVVNYSETNAGQVDGCCGCFSRKTIQEDYS